MKAALGTKAEKRPILAPFETLLAAQNTSEAPDCVAFSVHSHFVLVRFESRARLCKKRRGLKACGYVSLCKQVVCRIRPSPVWQA